MVKKRSKLKTKIFSNLKYEDLNSENLCFEESTFFVK